MIDVPSPEQLDKWITERKSVLCVGLDVQAQIYRNQSELFEFLKIVIDITAERTVAYKVNLAFYLSLPGGIDVLEKLFNNYLPKRTHLCILDAKFNDVEHTMERYLAFAFRVLGAHGVTVSPFFGTDAFASCGESDDRWLIPVLLPSSSSFLRFFDSSWLTIRGELPYERIARKLEEGLSGKKKVMYVVGATAPAELLKLMRTIVKDRFMLVPGVGAQGGDCRIVGNLLRWSVATPRVLINISRGILYPVRYPSLRDVKKAFEHWYSVIYESFFLF